MDAEERILTARIVTGDFVEFVENHEPTLRRALIAACGGQAGRDAACDALAYGWEHWERIQKLDNPVGYLFKVGRNRARRKSRRRDPVFPSESSEGIPDIEPGLLPALSELSERQRTAVVLVHCYQFTLTEVGGVLNISKTTVQNHLERGMARLRRRVGGFS